MEVWNIRGYLYEIFIAKHLKDNGFDECCKGKTTRGCSVNSKGEIEGRGEYHQIDFAGIYTKLTPYIYPLRVLAECKYYKEPLEKKIIRQYVGVVKDISENYYVPSETKRSHKESIFDKQVPRFTDIPIIFSVNGFDTHSENLAWAQGINLVSHRGIPVLDEIVKTIDELAQDIKDFCVHHGCKESDCINLIRFALNEVENLQLQSFRDFIDAVNQKLMRDNTLEKLHNIFHLCHFNSCSEKTFHLSLKIREINTFIMATTDKGTVINLISADSFPTEFYRINQNLIDSPDYNPNKAYAGVYYEQVDNEARDRVFYFRFNDRDVEDNRKFYFQPNRKMLGEQFPELSEQKRIDIKRDFVGTVKFIYKIDKVSRVLEIEVKFPSETREELNRVLEKTDKSIGVVDDNAN